LYLAVASTLDEALAGVRGGGGGGGGGALTTRRRTMGTRNPPVAVFAQGHILLSPSHRHLYKV